MDAMGSFNGASTSKVVSLWKAGDTNCSDVGDREEKIVESDGPSDNSAANLANAAVDISVKVDSVDNLINEKFVKLGVCPDESDHFQKGLITADLIDGIAQKDDEEMLRVKVYELSDSGSWNDKGTGYLITEMRKTAPVYQSLPSPLIMKQVVSLPQIQPPSSKSNYVNPKNPNERKETTALSSRTECSSSEECVESEITEEDSSGEPQPLHVTDLPPKAVNGNSTLQSDRDTSSDTKEKGERLIGPQLPHCFQRPPPKPVLILKVRAEDSDKILVPETNTTLIKFEKQGDTILSWEVKVNEVNVDLALSFQREQDFNLIWGMLESQKDRLKDPTYGDFAVYLPIPCISNIIEVVDFVCHHGDFHTEHIIPRICTLEWHAALRQCFLEAENSAHYSILELIYCLLTKVLSLSGGHCTKWWTAPTRICDTISLLEYSSHRRDKSIPHKKHRNFLKQHIAQSLPDIEYPEEECWHEVVNHTFQLEYLKDTVLHGQLLDAATTQIQQSLISNYQTLFNCILNSDNFIKSILENIRKGATSENKQVEKKIKLHIDFMVELVNRVRPMLDIRTEVFRKFEDTGLYEVLTLVLSQSDATPSSSYKLWLAIVELLTGLIGRIPCIDPLYGFRTYICNWVQNRRFDNRRKSNILERLTYGLTVEEDLNRGLIIQLYHLLTLLLKCFDSPFEFHHSDVMYSHVMEYFLKDLGKLLLNVINRKWHPGSVQGEKTWVHQKNFCIELFISLVKHQEVHMQNFVKTEPVIESIARLIGNHSWIKPFSGDEKSGEDVSSISTKSQLAKEKYPTLTLAAVRFLKVCILNTTHSVFTKCITSQELMRPIIECFVANRSKDNLISATCRSLLEAIIMNNMRGLLSSIAFFEYDKREDLDSNTRSIFEKIKTYHTANESVKSVKETVQVGPHLSNVANPILIVPKSTLPIHTAGQTCVYEEEKLFSEEETDSSKAASTLELWRKFQPPKRKLEPELDLLANKVAKKDQEESSRKQTATLTSSKVSSESCSSQKNTKKKGIISFTVKTKRKKSLGVMEGTKKKKPRLGS